MLKKLAMFFCLLSVPLLGHTLNGEYGITGFDPYTQEPYHGKAFIKQKGDVKDVYDITWHIKPQGHVYSGTGMRKGDTFVAVFKNLHNESQIGVHSYDINGDTLSGKWLVMGKTKQGSETLKLINEQGN